MKVTLVWVGKTNTSFVKEGFEEYLKRLKHYTKLEVIEIPDVKSRKALSKKQIIALEQEQIEKVMSKSDYVCLLDETGKQQDSLGFAKYIQDLQNRSTRNICFIIGGAYGVSEECKRKVNHTLSFSKMTLTHQMIRLFFIEQLYRSFTIINNEKYHH